MGVGDGEGDGEGARVGVAVGAGLEASTGVAVAVGVAVGATASVAVDEGFCEKVVGLDFDESKAGKAKWNSAREITTTMTINMLSKMSHEFL
jgi:hypothetical protein